MNQTKPMPKLAAALAFLASLLLIVSLLFTALQLVMHDETWFAARYEAYGTAGEIGIPTKDITAALMQLIDYMEGDVASIDLTVMENGIPVSMYNERETLHMIDLLADRCARFAGVVVCDQLGCGQRRLDLMHPHLNVVFVFVFRDAVALDVFLHRSAGLVDDLI